MGRMCPECNTYQPVVKVITADLGSPTKASDVIAVQLGCGHVVGEEDYKAYAQSRQKILSELAEKKRSLESQAASQLAAAYKALRDAKKAREGQEVKG